MKYCTQRMMINRFGGLFISARINVAVFDFDKGLEAALERHPRCPWVSVTTCHRLVRLICQLPYDKNKIPKVISQTRRHRWLYAQTRGRMSPRITKDYSLYPIQCQSQLPPAHILNPIWVCKGVLTAILLNSRCVIYLQNTPLFIEQITACI